MSRLHYTISDFCIVKDGSVPVEIADDILQYFVIPLSQVQDEVPFEVFVSYSKDQPEHPSGYRPYLWEIARGRSGGSQHTFGERKNHVIKEEKGAVDLTCEDFEINKDALLKSLIKHTPYLRFAVYPTFIHCDMRDLYNGRKRLFKSGYDSKWKFECFLS